MNKNKIFTFILLSIVGVPSFAQGVIYKCTDANGDISYSSESTTGRCEKTNLAKLDNGNILNKPTSFNNNSSSSSVAPTVQNSDQIVRDQKRAAILQGELSQEKTQLQTVLLMISKADKNDSTQIEHLKKMEQTHKRNIASLEKELGIKNEIQIANTPKGLPFTLPGVEQVEIVQPPPIRDSSYQNKVVSNPNIKSNAPYILINPSATNKTVTNNPVAAVEANPPIQIVKPEVVKEVREPAAITNKSLKKRFAPNSPMN